MEKIIYCLLVDDDNDDQELFALALESIDVHIVCTVVNNGIEALDYLSEKTIKFPDVIFLDLNMPKMNGKDCLKIIKTDVKLKHIPVVIFSTSSDPSDEKEMKLLGALQFITKPPRISELIQVLGNFFSTLAGS